MSKNKKTVRCWVCGVPATRSMSSVDHICDHALCETVTRHHMEMEVAYAKAEEQKEKYMKGAAV